MDQFSLFSAQPEVSKEPHIVYFDLETLRSADDVGGWGNIKNMGMACGVVYSTQSKEYHTFLEPDVMGLVNFLKTADLVVGYNHIRFDYEVLRGYSSFDFLKLPSFDMLVDLKNQLGFRVKLDSVAKFTIGQSKSADGLQSLQWVKEGKMDQVVEYCKTDVKVTKDVFEYGCKNHHVKIDDFGRPKEVSVDWTLKKVMPSPPISEQASLL